jgi:hypothetical protein
MAEFIEQTYGPGVNVDLDGNAYTRCVFDRCRMHFSGGALPTFKDVKFRDVIWHWDGAAGNGLALLSALYNHFGPTGRRDAEEMIRNIRSGKMRTE